MKRGRKSLGDLSVIIDATRRQPPATPSELSDAQSQVWRDVVGSMPGDWINHASQPLLIEYARHVCRSRLLERQIAKFEVEWTKAPGGLERFDRLLAMADRETRAMNACARALRLTPRSVDPKTAGRRLNNNPPSAYERPWKERA